MKSEIINATAEMGIWVWTAKPPLTTANKFNVKMVGSAIAYPKQPLLNVYAQLGLRDLSATRKSMNARKIHAKTEVPVLMKSETINATAQMGILV